MEAGGIPGFNTGFRSRGDTRVQYRIQEYRGYQGSRQDTGVEGKPGFKTGYRSRGDTRVQDRIQE